MRAVNVNREWRRALGLRLERRCCRVSFTGISGFEDGAIDFEHFATAVVGGNGTGKSTLLDIIRVSVDETIDKVPDYLIGRMSGALLKSRLELAGNALTIKSIIDEHGRITRTRTWEGEQQANLLGSIQHYDIASEARYLKKIFADSEARATLLEGTEARDATSDELKRAKWLSRKEYSGVRIYEVQPPSDYSGNDDAIPYFVVTEGDASPTTYGTEAMGLGELCLFLYEWHLKRLPALSFVLIDEPEASLPPWSQLAIVRRLASIATAKKCSFVLCTHSDHVIVPMSTNTLRLLYRVNGRTRITANPARGRLITSLSLQGFPDAFILCEDRLADKVLDVLIHRSPEVHWVRVEHVRVGSESRITSIVDSSPIFGSFRVVGAYDGDRRGETSTARHSHKLFLPGGVSPEALIRSTVLEQKQEVAAALGIQLERLEFVIAMLEGTDVHDWFESLVREIHVSEEQLINAVLDLLPAGSSDSFAQSLYRVVSLDSVIASLEDFANLHVDDRPPKDFVMEIMQDARDALNDPEILVGESWRERGNAVLGKLARDYAN